jgi:hypothetical protein
LQVLRLACLQELTISNAWLLPGDALALTALMTRLTSLSLTSVGAGVDAAVATALASSLTQLRHLGLLYQCTGGCDEFHWAFESCCRVDASERAPFV